MHAHILCNVKPCKTLHTLEYICVHACTDRNVSTYTYIHIYIHTYIHTLQKVSAAKDALLQLRWAYKRTHIPTHLHTVCAQDVVFMHVCVCIYLMSKHVWLVCVQGSAVFRYCSLHKHVSLNAQHRHAWIKADWMSHIEAGPRNEPASELSPEFSEQKSSLLRYYRADVFSFFRLKDTWRDFEHAELLNEGRTHMAATLTQKCSFLSTSTEIHTRIQDRIK